MEKVRQEFEAWAGEEFYSGLASVADTWNEKRGMYMDYAHHMAWCAWRASREAIEIEILPESECCGGCNCYYIRDSAIEAIEGAGLKVKP